MCDQCDIGKRSAEESGCIKRKKHTGSIDCIRIVFEHFFAIECDDALRYDLSSLEVKNITEFKEYHGVNISVMAYLDKTRVPCPLISDLVMLYIRSG